MTRKFILQYCLALIFLLFVLDAKAFIEPSELVDRFVDKMVNQHHFEAQKIQSVLQAAEMRADIIKKISSPAEGLPWYKYRKIFMTDKRIDGGVEFWKNNAAALSAVSKRYNVPEEIIIAIIGVETQYGVNVGTYRVVDALATLGFGFPKRSEFFLSELENFLILCREEHLDPLKPVGSYAGAMGLPQFMPSSFRNFAVDFEQDQARDIWHNPADAIASVANYFAKHQWQNGEAVFIPAVATDDTYKNALSSKLEPDLTVLDLKNLNISIPELTNLNSKAKLLAFEQETGDELWLGLHNFYVITRYNRSPLYAMAVYQLAQAIADKVKK